MLEKLSSHKRIATGMAALAVAGYTGESVQAKTAGGKQAAGIEAVQAGEMTPAQKLKLREKIVNMLDKGKLPNRVFDAVITFSTHADSQFFTAPIGKEPDTMVA